MSRTWKAQQASWDAMSMPEQITDHLRDALFALVEEQAYDTDEVNDPESEAKWMNCDQSTGIADVAFAAIGCMMTGDLQQAAEKFAIAATAALMKKDEAEEKKSSTSSSSSREPVSPSLIPASASASRPEILDLTLEGAKKGEEGGEDDSASDVDSPAKHKDNGNASLTVPDEKGRKVYKKHGRRKTGVILDDDADSPDDDAHSPKPPPRKRLKHMRHSSDDAADGSAERLAQQAVDKRFNGGDTSAGDEIYSEDEEEPGEELAGINFY